MKYGICKGRKKQVSFYSDEKLIKQFQEHYPHCLTLALNKFLQACIFHPDLFQKVFFDLSSEDNAKYCKEYIR